MPWQNFWAKFTPCPNGDQGWRKIAYVETPGFPNELDQGSGVNWLAGTKKPVL